MQENDLWTLFWRPLREKDSTDVTSVEFNQDRLSIVIETTVGADGSLRDSQRIADQSVYCLPAIAEGRITGDLLAF